MIESDDLSALDWAGSALPDLADLGPLALEDLGPTADLHEGAIADIVTENTPAGMLVATDSDRDGLVDHLTIIDRTGEYAGWEYRHDECGGRWARTSEGTIGS